MKKAAAEQSKPEPSKDELTADEVRVLIAARHVDALKMYEMDYAEIVVRLVSYGLLDSLGVAHGTALALQEWKSANKP